MSEEHKEECSQCGGKCGGDHGPMGDKMGMMMHMPKEMKVAMLEKKEKIMEAELDFIKKMKEIVKNKPEQPK